MKSFKIAVLLFTLGSSQAYAEISAARMVMVEPQPPAHNPHAPTTPEDRRRVDFAVAQIRSQYGPQVEIVHPHVIPWSFQQFEKNRGSAPVKAHASEPVIAEIPPQGGAAKMAPPAPMPSPQLKPDEYMVHAYVRYPGDPRWHHLDVILTEDSHGNPSFRGFFDVVMPSDPGRLPPGVVC